MATLRTFAENDIPAVAALFERVYPQRRWASQAACEAYFREILFNNPWRNLDLPSWVAEEDGGLYLWAQFAYYRAAIQVGDHHVGRRHLVVRHTARFDHDQAFFARYGAGVAEGVDHQAAADQLEIGVQNFSAQRFQHVCLPWPARR